MSPSGVNDEHEPDTYLALTFGGLASLAADLLIAAHGAGACQQPEQAGGALARIFEIVEICDDVNDESQGQCGCGKIVLRTNAPPQELWRSRCISIAV